MGATNFENTLHGKTAVAAFDALRSEIDSTDGYSGTIAEKDGFIEFTLPARVSADWAITWLDAADYFLNSVDKQAKAEFEKCCPEQHRAWALRVVKTYADKWAPAVCLRWSKSASATWKKENGYKGCQGDVFTFCGLASC